MDDIRSLWKGHAGGRRMPNREVEGLAAFRCAGRGKRISGVGASLGSSGYGQLQSQVLK